ncbi:hypothetical protein RI367_005539 [Sorochytrium milnesiophthora]
MASRSKKATTAQPAANTAPQSRIREEKIWVDRVTEELRCERDWEGKWGFVRDAHHTSFRTTSAASSKIHSRSQPRAWNPYNSNTFFRPGCMPSPEHDAASRPDAPPNSTYGLSYNQVNSTYNRPLASDHRLTTKHKYKRDARVAAVAPGSEDPSCASASPATDLLVSGKGSATNPQYPTMANLPNNSHTATLTTYAFNARNAAAIKKYHQQLQQPGGSSGTTKSARPASHHAAAAATTQSSSTAKARDMNIEVVNVYKHPPTTNMEYGFNYKTRQPGPTGPPVTPDSARSASNSRPTSAAYALHTTTALPASQRPPPPAAPTVIVGATRAGPTTNLINPLERFGNISADHSREALRQFNASLVRSL